MLCILNSKPTYLKYLYMLRLLLTLLFFLWREDFDVVLFERFERWDVGFLEAMARNCSSVTTTARFLLPLPSAPVP